MGKKFNFEVLNDHELYHLRLGKGALIVAIPSEDVTSAKAAWDKYHRDLKAMLALKVKPRKREIETRLRELERARDYLGLEEIKPGIHRRKAEVSPEKRNRIVSEIDLLRKERSTLSIPEANYRSNMQLAMFYTHNLAPNSEVSVRFDPVLEIEETESHVVVSLVFSDSLRESHQYHRTIMFTHGLQPMRDNRRVEGIVKRVIPARNVSLEIISRKGIDLQRFMEYVA